MGNTLLDVTLVIYNFNGDEGKHIQDDDGKKVIT